MFARRRRNVFKGPSLSLTVGGGAAGAVAHGRGERESRSGSVQGRPSGEQIIEEEDEDDEEYVEEVDEFSPVKAGETVEVLEERTPTVGASAGR